MDEIQTKPNFDYEKMNNYSQLNDTKSSVSIPVLRISYNAKSIYPRGSWVLGQKLDKDQKEVIEQGQLVKQVVILLDRNKYSFISNIDGTKNCSSPIFRNREEVQGNKHHYTCNKSCPFRNKDNKESCSAQKMIFCYAIVDGKSYECVMYLKGTSYMPIVEYLEEATKYTDESGKTHTLPSFSFRTNLASKSEVSKSKEYYVAVFSKGQWLNQESVDKLALKAKEIDETVIPTLNKMSIDNKPAQVREEVIDSEPVRPVTNLQEAAEKMQNAVNESQNDAIEYDESMLF
jgi:hypothetical protein